VANNNDSTARSRISGHERRQKRGSRGLDTDLENLTQARFVAGPSESLSWTMNMVSEDPVAQGRLVIDRIVTRF